MASQYLYGSVVRISTNPPFQVGGVNTDPTTITLKQIDPLGNVTSWVYPAAPIIRDSAGTYHADVTPNLTSFWIYRWEGTGVCIAVGEVTIEILHSLFYPSN